MGAKNRDGALSFTARLDVSQAKKNAEDLKKSFNELWAAANKSGATKPFDVKPLTEYQAGILKIKQEALELAKQNAADKKAKQEQAAAERSASLATQAALKEEAKLRREQLSLQKQTAAQVNQKQPVQVSNTQAEIDAYKKAQQGSMLYTSAINSERVARAQLNAESAKQAIASSTLTTGVTYNTNATSQQIQATNQSVLSKKQLAQMLAEEKLRQAEATKELRNNAREMLNAKGSLEQRKAALERLITVYGRMSVAERQSASGQRMNTIIQDLGAQINKLDPTKVEKISRELKKVPESLPKPSDGNLFTDLFSSIAKGALSVLAPLAAIRTVWDTVKEIFSHNVEISDSFADVRRTAKLSIDEVDNLSESLKGLNTRTNLEGLLDIATIGGRLGVAQKELPDFIKQVDELAVILKKELPGGAEAIAESLGKIVTIYKVTKAEGVSLGTALSKVGSNLLELAHSGPVTLKYLQDFTLGVAGTAASAKLSIPVISAYGAVLGESGQIASSSALAVTRLVSGLTTKPGKYAAIAQLADETLTVEKFTKIVNTDTQQALSLFFKGLKSGNPVATEFATRLASVGINTGKVTNAVKVLAENQDKLSDRISKGSKAFEEGASVAHNFEIANDTLGASVDKLGNSIVNLTTNPNSNMYNFFKGVIDGATKSVTALDILLATVKGLTNDPNKFIQDSATKSRAETLEKINEEAKRIAQITYKNSVDDGSDGRRLEILKEEVKIRDVIQIQYLKEKIAYENTPVRDRSLAQTQQFQETEKNLVKQIALVRELNKLRNKGKVDIVGTGELPDSEKSIRTIDDIKADIKRVTELKKPLDTASKQYKEYLKQLIGFKKELKLANGIADSGTGSENAAVQRAKSLGQKLTDIHNASLRNQKESDESELDSVKDKYDKMREEVDKFYSDPKNLNRPVIINGKPISRSKVEGQLKADEGRDTELAKAKQSIENTKKQIETQKVLFDEYEQFKLKTGEKAANDRYASEIKDYKSYVDYLKKQLPEETDTSVFGNKKRDLINKELLPKAENDQLKRQEDEYTALLLSTQDFEDEKLRLEAIYQQQRLKLLNEGKLKNVFELDKQYKEEQDALIENFIARSDIMKRLGERELILTRSEAKKQIAGLENALKDITIPDSTKSAIEKNLNDLKVRLNIGVDQSNLDILRKRRVDILGAIDLESKKATPSVSGLNAELNELNEQIDDLDPKGKGKVSGLQAFLNGLKDNKNILGFAKGMALASDAALTLSEGLGGVDTKAGYTLETIGQLAGAAADLGASIATGDPSKIIGSAIKAVGTLFTIGKKVKEINAAARKEVADYYANAISGEREYQDLLKERAIENVRNNKVALQGIRDEVSLRKSQMDSYKKESDEIMQKLQDQDYISGYGKFKHATWFRKEEKNPIYESLAGKSFVDLSQLLAQGKLDGEAKALVERLKELEQKGYDAEKALADLAKQTSELFTGPTSDSLTDSLAQMFASGKTSVQDLAEFFKQTMDDAALSIFKNKVLAQAMENFYKEFDAASQSDDGLTAAEIARLNGLFNSLTADAIKKFEEFQKITGSDLKGGSTITSALGKGITQITSDQASALEGITRGQYDLQKQLVVSSGKQVVQLANISTTIGDFFYMAKGNLDSIAANTLRTADNTANTVTELKNAVAELKGVNKNTTNTGGSYRGSGFG